MTTDFLNRRKKHKLLKIDDTLSKLKTTFLQKTPLKDKRQTTVWEKIFTKQGVILRIYKELLHFNKRRQSDFFKMDNFTGTSPQNI